MRLFGQLLMEEGYYVSGLPKGDLATLLRSSIGSDVEELPGEGKSYTR